MQERRDSWETCERAVAALRIYGDHLDPSAVTTTLRIHPSSTQEKGEVFINSLGRERTARVGLWVLSSEGHVDSLDLRRHLDWLIERLLASASDLYLIREQSDVEMYVHCIWWSRYGDGGPVLDPSHMRALGELELACHFEVAFYGEDDEDG